MTAAWLRRACDRATNLGISLQELSRRVHAALNRRDVVEAALDLETMLQRDMDRLERERRPI